MERIGKQGAHAGEALGESAAFLDFQQRLSRAAKVERPVLVVGERGTGKELAVARLHYLSQRWQGPLLALNAAALSPSVLESELFGHEAGAFTGAARRRIGRFEAADGGTLFLDEIGLVPLTVQEKILRVVEYGSFERVGGSEAVEVDVRIIGATNADLPALAAEGKFKDDLLDRLSFEVLRLPPLRERLEDLELLVRHFATRMALELGWQQTPEFTSAAMQSMQEYRWPGNIRELKNVVERAVYASDGKPVSQLVFDPFPKQTVRAGEVVAAEVSLPERLKELEITSLRSALDEVDGHQGKAAERLGLGYHQFRALYRKHRKELKR